ncbi:peptidylprolyl isomerase [Sphingomonas sp. RS6]
MLKAFRNFTKSRYGLVAVFIFLGIIALAFAAGDITGMRNGTLGGNSTTLATVDGKAITDADVRDRIQRLMRNAQAQGQSVTMAQVLAQGGLEAALNDAINTAALESFANDHGMIVGKRLVDTEIASNAQFAGMDGKFSQQTYEALLAQNRIAPAQFRDAIASDRYATWLMMPATMTIPAPDGVVLPYASMMLERRTGTIGFVQSLAMDPGADPDAKTLADYYARNRSRYLVPERRVVRYALVAPESLRAKATPTDAEIAEAYKKGAARFAASEKRAVELVAALDRATAEKVAKAAASGSLADAAKGAGLEMRKVDAADKAALGKQVSDAFADAAFTAPANTLTGPVQLAGTWYVYRVTAVDKIAARSLDQVRGELTDEVAKRKLATALTDLRQKIDDGIGDGNTFEEAVRDAGLTATRSPALAADGSDPDKPGEKADDTMVALMKAGFGFDQPGDEPQIVAIGQDGGFALIGLERIVPAAPRPLAQITEKVKADYLLDQALAKARKAASDMLPKLQKGMSMAQAMAEAGVNRGAPPKPFDFRRRDIQGKENFIQMAFDMPAKTARLVEAPGRAGYYVVYVDSIQPQSAAGDQAILQPVKGALTQLAGNEYQGQFSMAIRKQLKVTRNESALARLRAELERQGAGGQ